ncbi:MAG: RCC1 domain-containing protein [Myxococcales bacterium]
MKWVALGVQSSRTCGVVEDGHLFCWGSPFWDVDDRNTDYVGTPRQVGTRSDWVEIADDCAIRSDGSLWCWGSNDFGEAGAEPKAGFQSSILGDGVFRVGDESEWTQVARGENAACGIRNGQLLCWGSNARGLVPALAPGLVTEPKQVTTDGWQQVAVGTRSTCGIRRGQVYCWGPWHSQKQRLAIPYQMANIGAAWTQVAVGPSGFATGIFDGSPMRWGGPPGELAIDPYWDGDQQGQWTRVAIAAPSYGEFSGDDWDDVTRCGIRDGVLACTGYNFDGGYGVQPPDQWKTYPGLWADMNLGQNAACAITTPGGELWCWGLGNNTPTRKGAHVGWTDIAMSSNSFVDHLGINAGALRTWGNDAAETQLAHPAAAWRDVDQSNDVACGILGSGLYCWGHNHNRTGVLASSNLDEVTSQAPLLINDGSGSAGVWKSISLGSRHACGLRSNSTLWCWGSNLSGELGIGRSWSPTPIPVDLE